MTTTHRAGFTPSPSLYPFTSRWLPTPAGRVHYIDEGAGRPILMCHGNPTWSFMHRHVVARLRSRFRCIALDHLGFGLSDHPPRYGHAPADHAAVVGELIRTLELDDLIVMGHDWGGPIGLAAAASAASEADRVSGLVLGNTWFWPADCRARFPMRDPAFPATTVIPRMREAFSDIDVVELPGARHFFVEDAPEQVAHAITARFTDRPGPSDKAITPASRSAPDASPRFDHR